MIRKRVERFSIQLRDVRLGEEGKILGFPDRNMVVGSYESLKRIQSGTLSFAILKWAGKSIEFETLSRYIL
jgi:hypothetical protein